MERGRWAGTECRASLHSSPVLCWSLCPSKTCPSLGTTGQGQLGRGISGRSWLSPTVLEGTMPGAASTPKSPAALATPSALPQMWLWHGQWPRRAGELTGKPRAWGHGVA